VIEDREVKLFLGILRRIKIRQIKDKRIVTRRNYQDHRYSKAVDNPREIDYNLVNAQQAHVVS
jgi:hypothetical protein